MPAERLTMRKIREVFRQKFDCDISNRQIAISCNIARSTVGEYLFRFQQAALSWPLPQDIDDNQLEQLLYPQLPAVTADQRPVPDCSYIHQQLRQKSVTLMLLWQEHKEQYPQGYQYSQFCRFMICTPTRCARLRSLWPCWVLPTTPMRKPPGANRYPTGLHPTAAPLASLAELLKSWCPTT